jgi:hypothetical protein
MPSSCENTQGRSLPNGGPLSRGVDPAREEILAGILSIFRTDPVRRDITDADSDTEQTRSYFGAVLNCADDRQFVRLNGYPGTMG